MNRRSETCSRGIAHRILRGGALVVLLACAVWLWGCGGGSGGSQTGQGTGAAGGGGLDGSTAGTGVVAVGGGSARISGTVTLPGNRSRAEEVTRAGGVTVTLYRGMAAAPVAVSSPLADGSYGFSQLPPGSYDLVVTGSGMRTQWDRLGLASGASLVENYKMSYLTQNPSEQELQGLTAQATWLMRGFYGFRFSPVLVSRMLKSNQANGLVRSAARVRDVAPLLQANVQTYPTVGAKFVWIDRGSLAWVSANDSFGGGATHTGVYKFTNDGTNQGLQGTGAATNSGGGPVATSNATDLLVANEYDHSMSLGLLPRGAAPPTIAALLGTPPTGGLSVWSLAPQNQLPTPRFVANVINDTGGTHAELYFINANGSFAKAAASTSLATTFLGRGVTCDPVDHSIYLVGDVNAGGGTRQAHFIHVSADGSTILEDVTLGSFAINGFQNLARDAAGTFYTSSSSPVGPLKGNVALVRISGTVGNRTVTSTPLVAQGGAPFVAGPEVDGDVVTVDSAGMIWALDCNANTVTRYDSNVQNPQTVNTGTHPTSIATDALNNGWIVCNVSNNPAGAVLNKVVVGGLVPTPAGVTTATLTDGSQVTTVPGTTTSPTLVTQVFTPTAPQSQFGNFASFGSTVVTGGVSTVEGSTDTYSGPAASTVTGSYDPTTNQYAVTSVTQNQLDQAVVMSELVFSPNGSGTVNGTMDDGSAFDATYDYSRANDGTVTVTARVTNPHANQTLIISATFNPDGSVSNFQVTNDATGLKTIARMTTAGKFNAQYFRLDTPGTPIATASNDQVSQSIMDSLMRFLTAPGNNTTDPESVWQMFRPNQPTAVTNSPAPGYREIIVIYYDAFGLHQVVTYVPVASVGNASGSSGGSYSPTTGSVPPDPSANNSSTLPPGTQGGGAFAPTADANLIAAGIGGTGGAGPRFMRWRLVAALLQGRYELRRP